MSKATEENQPAFRPKDGKEAQLECKRKHTASK